MVLYQEFCILWGQDEKVHFSWNIGVFFCFLFFFPPFFLDFLDVVDEHVYHDDVEEVLEESDEEGSEGSIGDCRRASGSWM